MRPAFLLLLVAACGGTSSGPPPAPVPSAISAIAPRASADDLEVARVGGRPVWASCVVEQAARQKLTRDQALEQCVAFELLAQEAERRELAYTAEVAEATREAMVSRLIAISFEATYKTPEDLGEFMTKILDKNAWRMHRPDVRSSMYLRIKVPRKAPPEAVAQGQALAQQIADALANESGLTEPHARAIAERIAGGNPALEVISVGPTPRDGLDDAYADLLYGIPEIGRAQGPARTPWGWDVILWTGGLPPKETTREELAAELFPDVRRAYFPVWVSQIAKQHGTVIEKHEDQLADDEGTTP